MAKNEVKLEGYLSFDPKAGVTKAGKTWANFQLSVFDGKQPDGKPKYIKVRVSCFGDVAEKVGNTCKARDKVTVTGKLTVDTYNDKETYGVMAFAVKGEEKEPAAVTADDFGSEVQY